jgi:hypothetical protein
LSDSDRHAGHVRPPSTAVTAKVVAVTGTLAESLLRSIRPAAAAWTRSAKINDVHRQACLADALPRINDLPVSWLDELLPWNWLRRSAKLAA